MSESAKEESLHIKISEIKNMQELEKERATVGG